MTHIRKTPHLLFRAFQAFFSFSHFLQVKKVHEEKSSAYFPQEIPSTFLVPFLTFPECFPRAYFTFQNLHLLFNTFPRKSDFFLIKQYRIHKQTTGRYIENDAWLRRQGTIKILRKRVHVKII